MPFIGTIKALNYLHLWFFFKWEKVTFINSCFKLIFIKNYYCDKWLYMNFNTIEIIYFYDFFPIIWLKRTLNNKWSVCLTSFLVFNYDILRISRAFQWNMNDRYMTRNDEIKRKWNFCLYTFHIEIYWYCWTINIAISVHLACAHDIKWELCIQ